MSTGRFAKRDREKARQAKAAAKRARRHGLDGSDADRESAAPAEPAPTMSQDDVLAALAKLHAAYDAEQMSLEDFEQARADLMAQLRI